LQGARGSFHLARDEIERA
jgi:hypothetical protein